MENKENNNFGKAKELAGLGKPEQSYDKKGQYSPAKSATAEKAMRLAGLEPSLDQKK